MTAADHPTGPRAVPARPILAASCPDDLALARFVDGTLPDGERPGMIEHLADCDDCREAVVMAAEAPAFGKRAEAPATVAPPAEAVPVPTPPPTPPARRYGPWAAAAVGLAATVVFAIQVQRPAPPAAADPAAHPWEAIAQAIGDTRQLEPRLSRMARHVPLTPPTRAGSGPAASLAASAVAAGLARAATPASPDSGHAAGVAALVAGQPGPALKLLDEAAAAAPESAEIRSDLAAVHLALAAQGSRVHWSAALEASDAALAIDPGLSAAHFNRALALEGLGRPEDARSVWQALAAADGDEQGWRDEAAAHLRRLSR